MKSLVKLIAPAFACLVILCGCSGVGPLLKPEYASPEYIPEAAYDRVIVSNFFESSIFHGLRVEQMPYYDTENYMYLQTNGKDISGLTSQALNSKGIPSKGMKNMNPKDLKEGEVMLIGIISFSNIDDIPILKILPFFILVGNVLPNPVGFISGAHISYRYEIIDNKSNILFQSGDRNFSIQYKHYWVWGSIFNRDKHFDDAVKQAKTMLVDELEIVLEQLND